MRSIHTVPSSISVVPLALASLVALAVWPGVAEAQIYAIRGEDGSVRYSTQPAPGAELFLETRHTDRGRRPSGTPAAGDLSPIIETAAEAHGLDPRLVESVIAVESAFDPGALSVKGAQGLMQLMPATAARFAVTDVWDPAQNIRGGTRYLRLLLDEFGDLRLALAAYNAGEGAVRRHAGVPPYAETRRYVDLVLRRYRGGGIVVAGGS